MFSTRYQNLKPYVPGEQPRDRQYIKLNTNENPYPPCPGVRSFLESFDPERLRRYPDPLFTELRKTAGEAYGLDPEYVFAGNGSDEVLSFCFFAFFDSAVAYADPTYSFYPVYCDFYGISGIAVDIDDDMGIDLDAVAAVDDVDGMVIANPNSPTGTYLPFEAIESVLERYPSDRVVVVDEAYIAFGGESVVPLVKRFDNLVVVHTFSKWASLAGLRLSVTYGAPKLIEALFASKDSFNSYPVHEIAQRLGVIALEDTGYYRDTRNMIIATRERVSRSLAELGWNVVPSRSNFLFVRNPALPGRRWYELLRERGILVRHFNSPELTDFLRITIGTDQEMDRLLDELARINGESAVSTDRKGKP